MPSVCVAVDQLQRELLYVQLQTVGVFSIFSAAQVYSSVVVAKGQLVHVLLHNAFGDSRLFFSVDSPGVHSTHHLQRCTSFLIFALLLPE